MKKVIPAIRRGRPPTGRIEPWRDRNGHTRYRARLTLADGSSERLPLPTNLSKEHAKAKALAWQLEEQETNKLYRKRQAEAAAKAQALGETTGEWFKRYTQGRAAQVLEADRNRIRWNKYIGPHLDHIPIAALDRSHIEIVRDSLDSYTRAGKLHPKSALNCWGVLTKAMREAVSSKLPGIRCRDTNPCDNVAAPDRGESRVRPWLTPNEVFQLLDSPLVPLGMRQVYAIAVYTYLRPGELAAATWGDVSFTTRCLEVRKARHWDTGETKKPKTRQGRRLVPLHENLLPLLEAMRGEPHEPLWRDLDAWDEARGGQTFREHLRLAGISREELFNGTPDTLPADLRSLRTTGATLAAISGLGGRTLERRIGHAGSSAVTERYIGIAEDITGGAIGEPFGPLPASLISATIVATKSKRASQPRETPPDSSCRRWDLNPHTREDGGF